MSDKIDEQNIRYSRMIHFGGMSIILDKIAADYLINNSDKLEYSLVDDLAIGILMRDNKGVNYIIYKGFAINTLNFDSTIFYRNKSENRFDDVNRMSIIISHLLKKKNESKLEHLVDLAKYSEQIYI